MFLHQLSAGAAKISVSLVAAPANKGAHRIGALSFNFRRLALVAEINAYYIFVRINVAYFVLWKVLVFDRIGVDIHSMAARELGVYLLLDDKMAALIFAQVQHHSVRPHIIEQFIKLNHKLTVLAAISDYSSTTSAFNWSTCCK